MWDETFKQNTPPSTHSKLFRSSGLHWTCSLHLSSLPEKLQDGSHVEEASAREGKARHTELPTVPEKRSKAEEKATRKLCDSFGPRTSQNGLRIASCCGKYPVIENPPIFKLFTHEKA